MLCGVLSRIRQPENTPQNTWLTPLLVITLIVVLLISAGTTAAARVKNRNKETTTPHEHDDL